MSLKVRKFNAQVRDSTTGNMIPAGLLSSDALGTIDTAKNAAVSAVQSQQTTSVNAVTSAGTAAAANFPATAAACDTLAGDFAATYVPDQAYVVGDYCTYQYQLYQCKTTIAANTDHTFVTSHWDLITVTDTIDNQVDDLKTQLDNITNEKIYQTEVYPYYAKTISGVGRAIAENSNYRSTIIPVVDGRHYKIEAIGRGNRNVVYGISDTSWDIGTVLTDLNYEPQINTATDNITIEITPNGYHFLFIIFAYSTQSEYPYSFVVKVTESTNDGQFSVIGIEVPTYPQFELLVGATNELTDDLEALTEKYNLIFNALKN